MSLQVASEHKLSQRGGVIFTWRVRHEGVRGAHEATAHDDRDVHIALGEFPRIFPGANSLILHPLSWLPQSLLVCLAGETLTATGMLRRFTMRKRCESMRNQR